MLKSFRKVISSLIQCLTLITSAIVLTYLNYLKNMIMQKHVQQSLRILVLIIYQLFTEKEISGLFYQWKKKTVIWGCICSFEQFRSIRYYHRWYYGIYLSYVWLPKKQMPWWCQNSGETKIQLLRQIHLYTATFRGQLHPFSSRSTSSVKPQKKTNLSM